MAEGNLRRKEWNKRNENERGNERGNERIKTEMKKKMASRVLGFCLESIRNGNSRDRVFRVNDLYVATYSTEP